MNRKQFKRRRFLDISYAATKLSVSSPTFKSAFFNILPKPTDPIGGRFPHEYSHGMVRAEGLSVSDFILQRVGPANQSALF